MPGTLEWGCPDCGTYGKVTERHTDRQTNFCTEPIVLYWKFCPSATPQWEAVRHRKFLWLSRLVVVAVLSSQPQDDEGNRTPSHAVSYFPTASSSFPRAWRCSCCSSGPKTFTIFYRPSIPTLRRVTGLSKSVPWDACKLFRNFGAWS